MKTPSQRRIKKYRTEIQLLYNYIIFKSYVLKKENIEIGYEYLKYPSIQALIKNYDNKNKNLTDYQIDLIQNNLFSIISCEYNPINYNIIAIIKLDKINVHTLNLDNINVHTLNLEANLNIYHIIFSQLKKIASMQIKEEIINKMVNDKINDIISFKDLLIEKI
jgi:hypothetical protein